jgi:hypothetical protein
VEFSSFVRFEWEMGTKIRFWHDFCGVGTTLSRRLSRLV